MKMLSSSFLLLSFLLPGMSQSQTFKGHHIGETAADFLKAEPAIQSKFIDCQSHAPRELTPEEIKAKYGKRAYQETLKRMEVMQPEAQRELQASGNPNTRVAVFDQDIDVYGDKCGALLDTLVKGTGRIDGDGYLESNTFSRKQSSSSDQSSQSRIEMLKNRGLNQHNRHFVFENGLLISFSLEIVEDWDTLEEDISKRLGVYPSRTSVPYHNAYGATWSNESATWDSNFLSVDLEEERNPAKFSLPWLTVSKRYDRIKAAEALETRRRSALD